jgi:hypothetical protein
VLTGTLPDGTTYTVPTYGERRRRRWRRIFTTTVPGY